MSEKKTRRCHACGEGEVKPTAVAGRVARYKTMPRVQIPADLPIPTCSKCGTEWLDKRTTQEVDAALEAAYRRDLGNRALISISTITSHVSQRKLERLLGLSQGYLSKLRSGERTPSAELVSQLALIALDPYTRVKELEKYWSSPPPMKAADG